jgi:nitrilase
VAVLQPLSLERLADTPERADLIEIGGGASQIFGPDGATLAGPPREDEEAIVTAEIDLGEIARAKNFADPVGHYSRPDIFRLVVNRAPQPCVQEVTSSAVFAPSVAPDTTLPREVCENEAADQSGAPPTG